MGKINVFRKYFCSALCNAMKKCIADDQLENSFVASFWKIKWEMTRIFSQKLVECFFDCLHPTPTSRTSATAHLGCTALQQCQSLLMRRHHTIVELVQIRLRVKVVAERMVERDGRIAQTKRRLYGQTCEQHSISWKTKKLQWNTDDIRPGYLCMLVFGSKWFCCTDLSWLVAIKWVHISEQSYLCGLHFVLQHAVLIQLLLALGAQTRLLLVQRFHIEFQSRIHATVFVELDLHLLPLLLHLLDLSGGEKNKRQRKSRYKQVSKNKKKVTNKTILLPPFSFSNKQRLMIWSILGSGTKTNDFVLPNWRNDFFRMRAHKQTSISRGSIWRRNSLIL